MERRTITLILVCVVLVGGAGIARWLHDKQPYRSAMEHFELSDHLQETGHLPEAITEMKQAIAEEPKYFEARLGLADMYQSDQHLNEAEQIMLEGKRVAPEDSARYDSSLCDILVVAGNYPMAIEYLRKSIAEGPPDKKTLRQLPMLLEHEHQWDEAKQGWETFHKQFPDDASGPRGLERVRRHRTEASHRSAE